jgi:hypothetical protein
MPPYKANSRGGHHRQNPRSRFQNLRLQYKEHAYEIQKLYITYHSKDMANVKVFAERQTDRQTDRPKTICPQGHKNFPMQKIPVTVF